MNQAFERHAAYLDQAWRTLQDSVLLKNQQSPYVGPNRDSTKDTADMAGTIRCDNPGCTNPATPTTVKWSAEGYRYCKDCVRGTIPSNIHRIVADNPSAADARHCQNEGCFAYRASDSPYCAPCKQYREDTNLV